MKCDEVNFVNNIGFGNNNVNQSTLEPDPDPV